MNRTDEVREAAAKLLEYAIGRGYPTPAHKVDQCAHGKFGWEDCIACYDEVLTETVEAIRALDTRATQPDAALREALEAAPIIARDEGADVFRVRQDEWLNGPYRAALDTGAGRGEA